MLRFFLVLLSAGFGILFSCTNADDKESQGEVYAKYTIWGEEGKELVNVFFQFHSGGPGGPALVLTGPAKVLLDKHLLIADSAKETGVFHELQIPIEDFEGAHTITFIDTNLKLNNTEPITLASNR